MAINITGIRRSTKRGRAWKKRQAHKRVSLILILVAIIAILSFSVKHDFEMSSTAHHEEHAR